MPASHGTGDADPRAAGGGADPADACVADPGGAPGRNLEVEPEPAAAATVFGAAIGAARRYADLLTGPGAERGLLGPREPGRIWSRHLLNCAVIGEVIPPGALVADVGSGAGLPGIPLALARPDCTVVLVEPLLRRAEFLAEVIGELGNVGVDNCRVVRARAEDLVPRRRQAHRRPRRGTPPGAPGSGVRDDQARDDPAGGVPAGGVPAWQPVDVVTSRAVAALDVLAGWCAPLLRPGGLMLAMKGSTAADEIQSSRTALTRWGLGSIRMLTVGEGRIDPPTVVVQAVRGDGRRG